MEDNDYDYSSILRLLKKKLEINRAHIDKHRIDSDWYLRTSQMTRAMELIDASLEDDGKKHEMKTHDKKWGKPKYLSLKVPGKPYFESRQVRVNVRTDKDRERESKEYLAIVLAEDRDRLKARKELFKLLGEKLWIWWC